ncbi:MCE family protein [Nocardia farcinica]|uniref:MCE family protein n=1 Tax=Nocardia farcinica TaxID=37329 RepID=UPI0018936F31|nr:MCE family protein [Nocardia farcinica]MBF6520282.1 MCE family protein [Nocardia farcinica]
MIRPTVKLGLFTVTMLALLAGVVTAIQRPVPGSTHRYEALFTDAGGLRTGDDVRMFGVEVGEVDAIALDGTTARVRFTAQTDRVLYDNSTIAIRYKNLTGQRYLDIRQPETGGNPLPPGATIATAHTVPSFDVTVLFNGLRPILADYSPEALNHLTGSLIAVIEGDGAGLGPALDSLGALSDHAADRQAVISMLIRNLADVAQHLGGKSPQTVVLLTQLANLFDELQRKVEGVVDFALTAPAVMAPLDSLLTTLGLTPNVNQDLNDLVRTSFPDPAAAVDTLSRIPGLLQALDTQLPPSDPTLDLGCSHGTADLPLAVDVLVAGQRVVVCR